MVSAGQDLADAWPDDCLFVAGNCEVYQSSHCSSWYDGLEIFAGLDGSKQPQDFGVNAQFGGRIHANWGIPVWEDSGVGFQIGTAVSQTDHAVSVTEALEGSSSRTQSFITAGIFQRSPSGWNMGVVYDHLYQDDYDVVTLGQVRGILSYELGTNDELGFVGMLPVMGSDATWGMTSVNLRPLGQGRLFWRHWWESGVQTTFWLGGSEPHHQNNAALGSSPATGEVFVYGADFQAPLNNYLALYGEANFITPADTGTVDAYLGIAFYPGGGAYRWQRRQATALLPVAGNPSFSVDLR
ncbi:MULTISPECIES: DUF6666 family protein [Pirellulaceae]|nr:MULTISPECIES: DUF6666 family protein [Pirellulaceae]